MDTTTCLFCHERPVPMDRWNLRCDECRRIQKEKDEAEKRNIAFHNRQPAAVIRPDGTQNTTVFVDKFGVEVPNHGYNLDQDPHGWKKNGKQGAERTMIR